MAAQITENPSPILQENDTCWRLATCGRARVLIDGADYFLALRRALLNARRDVFIIGWDIDSRTPLVGPGGEKDRNDDLPVTFGAFLTELVKRRPELKIHLLLWDYSMLYALEREPLPAVTLNWTTPPQISVCLDDVLPVGASHHQKVVVIDDALAFSGGLDITIRRWDTPDHVLGNPERCDPRGSCYRPFHDIQMMVDGDAARSLAELVRDRWQRAACEKPTPLCPQGDPWPAGFAPDFTDTRIGIARTFPAYDGDPEVREVERLFLRTIAVAEKSLYIENQFLTTESVCEALIERLKEKPDLEVLIVAPNVHQSWLEERAMNAGRKRFMERLRRAGVDAQVRLVFPALPADDTGEGVMVHAKVMVADDRLLRVGSANLNNRSMGMDTECDLAVEGGTEEERRTIVRLRNDLLAEHLGQERAEIEEALAQDPSLFALVERFAGEDRSLQPIDLSAVPANELSQTVGQLADPERPIATPEFIGDMFGGSETKQRLSRIAKLAACGVVLLGLVALWRYTPLSTYTDPQILTQELRALAGGFWMPFAVIAAFLFGSLLAFPVTVLIVMTGMIFAPLPAFGYALAASLLTAAMNYGIGRAAGTQPLRNLVGPKVNRISRALSNRGVISVAALRMVPIAPFSFINLAAGASQIKFTDFIAGTFLGMAPGILVITLLGNQLSRVLDDPEPQQLALFGGLILAWLGVSLGLQALATRLRSPGNA
jgi:phospholipase D1/2